MCGFVQHQRRWRQVLVSFNGHKLHNGEISCLNFFWVISHIFPLAEFEDQGGLGIRDPGCIPKEV